MKRAGGPHWFLSLDFQILCSSQVTDTGSCLISNHTTDSSTSELSTAIFNQWREITTVCPPLEYGVLWQWFKKIDGVRLNKFSALYVCHEILKGWKSLGYTDGFSRVLDFPIPLTATSQGLNLAPSAGNAYDLLQNYNSGLEVPSTHRALLRQAPLLNFQHTCCRWLQASHSSPRVSAGEYLTGKMQSNCTSHIRGTRG